MTWYLPIFNVKNPHKPEKFRRVFDSVAVSKEESFKSGKTRARPNKLYGVLLRFCKGAIGLMYDIKFVISSVSNPCKQKCPSFSLVAKGKFTSDVQGI